ncbi:hypothetical protein M413DRAFT_187948 [Hebeloma cylindrosporum]|uniref:F-box domain-containing protein n=1 Tax=Hebeloma cylindrosporum TaxID=76867 RepID=A0A0C3C6T8_HEBCY|nr:hypothetical protein M413DRAFT_187948 [Hebeloma cylindrosporum h7]
MADFPTEIWLHILHYLPIKDLSGFIGATRYFNSLGMDVRYEVTEIRIQEGVYEKDMRRVAEPAIARRIKSLKLWARVVYTPFEMFPVTEPRPRFRRLPKSMNCAGRVRLPKIIMEQRQPTTPVVEAPAFEDLKLTFDECLDWFLVALPHMVNVRDFELHIDTKGRPTYPNQMERFLGYIWMALRQKLQKLTFNGTLPDMAIFLRSKPPHINVVDVNFTLYGPQAARDAVQEKILAQVMPNYVKSLGPGFHSLTLRSWNSQDLTIPLMAFTELPDLRLIYLEVTFTSGSVPSKSVLKSFFNVVSLTLETLKFVYSIPGFDMPLMKPAEVDIVDSAFLSCLANPGCFFNLRILEFHVRRFPKSVDLLLGFIKNSSAQLMQLTLTGPPLPMSDVDNVLLALSVCNNLTHLHFGPLKFNSNLIDSLAENIPRLYSLELDLDSNILNLSLGPRQYKNWKLYNITIRDRRTLMLREDLMKTVATLVHSVRSFGGTGRMSVTPSPT